MDPQLLRAAQAEARRREREEELQNSYQRSQGKPVKVTGIVFEGNKNTREGVLRRAFEAALNSQTYDELGTNLVGSVQELQNMGHFKSVNCLIDKSKDDTPNGAVVIVHIVEKKNPVTAKTGTNVSTSGEANFETNLQWRNVFGGGETVNFDMGAGNKSSKYGKLWLDVPYVFGSSAAFSASLHRHMENRERHSSYSQKTKGLSLMLTEGSHRLGYSFDWRDVVASKGASFRVHEGAGSSVKSALTHVFSSDGRDSDLIPNEGSAVRVTNELAGLGGDVKYIKTETVAETNFRVFPGIYGQVAFAGGAMRGLSGDTSRLTDRFFLGGGSSLRGFRNKSIGPHDYPAEGPRQRRGDALGGDAYLSLHGALSFDLPSPLLMGLRIRGQVFGDVGNCMALQKGNVIRQAKDFASHARASAGVGFIIPTPLGKMELNHVWPLRTQHGDRYVNWQLGVTFNPYSVFGFSSDPA